MKSSGVRENAERILRELPKGVQLVAAVKARTNEEIKEAILGGVKIIGENYVQEAEKAFTVFTRSVEWHFVGHLQRNKIKKVVGIFDMVETIDSLPIALELDKTCGQKGKIMPVLIEINSAREEQKFGISPEAVRNFAEKLSDLSNIKVMGLMTMGPFTENLEDMREAFRETRKIFEMLKEASIKNAEMKYLSMGMTTSYKIAIEEGANMVRIGTKIFGERK